MGYNVVDRVESLNGAPVSEGDFLNTTTDACRALRLLVMEAGQWPGGNGREDGNRMWARAREAADHETTRRQMLDDCELALRPMVEDGSASGVEASTERNAKGRLVRVHWKGRRGDPNDIVLRDPYSLNG